MLSAVGFDLDNTLVVTDPDRETLLDTAARRVGAPPLSRAAYRAAHRADIATETREPIFEELVADEAGVTAAEITAAYRAAIEEAIEPIPGAAELIRSLRTDYRVGLLTDGPVRAQQGKLEQLGWTDLFDAVVITGTLPAGKPDERAFQALLKRLDVEPGDTAYVGDAPDADIVGAAAAGLHTVQVLGPGEPRAPAADATIRRDRLVADLPAILQDLGAGERPERA